MQSSKFFAEASSWAQNSFPLKNPHHQSVFNKFLSELWNLPVERINGPFVRKVIDTNFCSDDRKKFSAYEKRALWALFVGACIHARILKKGRTVATRNFPAEMKRMFVGDSLVEGVTDIELSRLGKFSEAIKELQNILDASRKQGLFLDVGQLLGEFETICQTGGSPSKCMQRKLKVFYQISGVVPKERRVKGRDGMFYRRRQLNHFRKGDDSSASASSNGQEKRGDEESSVESVGNLVLEAAEDLEDDCYEDLLNLDFSSDENFDFMGIRE